VRQALGGGAWLPAAAGALLVFALFASRGSSETRLFWIGVGGLVVATVAVVLRSAPLTWPVIAFLGLLGLFALWQALTIAWSISPDSSWRYANRTFVYLAFGVVGVLLGTSVPRRRLAAGLGFLSTALLVVALAAKALPFLYEDYGRLARLRWPVAYWNELALLAAMTVPLGLWLAGRRDRPLRARVAGVLHVYVALVAVVLTFSRFGIILAVAGAIAWMSIDRDRLDSLVAALIAAPVAAIVAGARRVLPGIPHANPTTPPR